MGFLGVLDGRFAFYYGGRPEDRVAPISHPLVHSGDQQQGSVRPGRLAALDLGEALDIEHQVHGCVYKVGIVNQCAFCNLGVQLAPFLG
jgi:hypothetical protein